MDFSIFSTKVCENKNAYTLSYSSIMSMHQKSYRNRVISWKVVRDSYVVVLISYKYRNIS